MKVLKKRDGMRLIILCFITYAVAYLSRLSYSANLAAIGSEYTNFTSADLGLISSFLFFAYAGGQLMSAILGRYYNPKWVVAIGMLITAMCNLGMSLTDDLTLLKLIWMVNGISQSVFWCNVCNIQAKYISREQLPLSIMLGGFSYCFGTCGIYALSAIFVNFNWRITFYTVFALALLTGILWFLEVSRIERVKKVDDIPGIDIQGEEKAESVSQNSSTPFFRGRALTVVLFVCLIAIMNSFMRDGVITWFPTILKGEFGFGDSLAILVTLGVSLVSTLGISLDSFLVKRIKGNIFLQIFFFASISAITLLAFLAFKAEIALIFILLFGLNVCMLYCNGHMVTSNIPYAIRSHGNVGSFSALLDCFCYIGSTLSTYIFGIIADKGGWGNVLIMIIFVAVGGAVVALIGHLIARKDPLTKKIF